MTGLELAALAGTAKQHGVTIGGGVFDANVDARFQPATIGGCPVKALAQEPFQFRLSPPSVRVIP